MTYELFTRVALRADIPQHRLRKGDVATIVERHETPPGAESGYSLEVFNALGDTLAVLTVGESQIEPLLHDEVLHVQQLETAGV
jgi:hypothetical protein